MYITSDHFLRTSCIRYTTRTRVKNSFVCSFILLRKMKENLYSTTLAFSAGTKQKKYMH